MTTKILDDYLPRVEAARELNKCPATLDRWRRLGDGPAFIKVGRDIYYRRSTISEWLEAQEQALS